MQRKVFRIPKDPRTENTIFIDEIPLDLVDIISCEDWKMYISQINEVFLEGEKPSIWNLIKFILVIPAFFKVKTFEKELDKAIKNVNSKLKEFGLKVENPIYNGCIELVVTYTLKK